MDPQSAWDEMLKAIADEALLEAELQAEALMEWLDKDGFPPQTCQRILPRRWDQMICRYVCRKVMIVAHTSGE